MPLINRCGGGSGVDIETCSVIIKAESSSHMKVTATIFKDDKIQPYSFHGEVASHRIDNVICGSTLTADAVYANFIYSYGNGVEKIDTAYTNSFKAPQTAGAVGSISMLAN